MIDYLSVSPEEVEEKIRKRVAELGTKERYPFEAGWWQGAYITLWAEFQQALDTLARAEAVASGEPSTTNGETAPQGDSPLAALGH